MVGERTKVLWAERKAISSNSLTVSKYIMDIFWLMRNKNPSDFLDF